MTVNSIDPNPIDPTGAGAELMQLLNSERAVEAMLEDVLALTLRRIPAAQEASITLIRDEQAHTIAAVGDLALALDELQYEKGYGPCLDAGRTDQVMHISDSATEPRWPAYLPPARERGLRSSLSLPLPVENYLIGALNLYSQVPGSFEPDMITLGTALATYLTAALSYAESTQVHRSRADNLERALLSRSVIEQAKGMIMAQRHCTAEQAFMFLRQFSMDENIRLQDLAVSFVASASGHPVQQFTPPPRDQR